MKIRQSVVVAVLVALVSSAMPGLGFAEEHGHESHAASGGAHEGHSDHIGLADADLGKVLKPEEIRSDLAFFTFVVFVLLLAILWKFAWGPIVAGLEKREEAIAKNIADAQRQHDEARQLLVDYERKLEGAAEQVRGILEEARRDAEHTKQSILAEAKSGAETERLRALRDIEGATDAAFNRWPSGARHWPSSWPEKSSIAA